MAAGRPPTVKVDTDDLKFSIVIPYKRRLDNIRVVFASLAEQTMDASQFEVIVGAMEYSTEYVSTCQEFTDRLNIVSVMTAGDWNVCHARNIAMRQVSGQVIVILDADMILPSRFLQNLYDHYFSHHQNVCVLGQAIDYNDELAESDVNTVELRPYSHHRKALAELEAMNTVRMDARFDVDPVLPWTFVWTGLVALPTAAVRQHGLTFDEGFHGWGRADQEWGYRISATGTPITLGDDVYGLHLPHLRDARANRETSKANSRYFLAKWPSIDVELAQAFGWIEANRRYLEIKRELTESVAIEGHVLGVARGIINGDNVLVIGAVIDEQSRISDPELCSLFDDGCSELLPLVGFALPYLDKSVDECRILPPILSLSPRYRDAVFLEAKRVASRVVLPAGAGPS